jgi:hypothetical protein
LIHRHFKLKKDDYKSAKKIPYKIILQLRTTISEATTKERGCFTLLLVGIDLAGGLGIFNPL